MASIKALLDLQNEFSTALNDMTQSLHNAVQPLDDITQSLNNVMQSLGNIASGLARVQINSPPNPNPNQNQRNADGGSNQGNADSSDKKKKGIGDKVKGAVTKNLSMENVGKVLNLSDQYAEASARLGMMNDNLQSTQDLMNMVHAAAQDSRSSFNDMSSAVIGFGANSGNAFDSSAEIVTFADLMQKQMAIAGMSDTDTSKAMQSLSKGLSDGVISGEELSSIFGEAPNMVQNIAEYLGVSTDQVTKMASAGNLTADIVKNAVFSASDEINEKFQELPMTWEQVGQSVENTALKVFAPVLQMINNLANSTGFQSLVTGAMTAISVLASAVTGIFEIMSTVGGFLVDNWSIIVPLILGTAAAIGVFTLAVKGAALASNIAKAAISAWNTVQKGFHAVMSMSPLAKIIILIILLISVIAAVCSWIAKTTDLASTGFGVMTGGINVVIQFFKNLGLTVANIALGIGNAFGAVCNNIKAAFYNTIRSVQSWWYSLLSTALTVVAGICEALNKLPFVEFDYSGISESAKEYAAKAGEAAKDKMAYENIGAAFDEGYNTFDTYQDGWVSDAFDEGAAWGDGVADNVKQLFNGLLGGDNELPDGKDFLGENEYTSLLDNSGMAEDLNSIAGSTDSISDSLDVSQEDLKYLRDIAEQEAVNRFTTAEVTINQTNNNNIASGMDLDGVLNGLDNAMGEAIDIMTEGAHA